MPDNLWADKYLIIEISNACMYEDAESIKKLLNVQSFQQFYTNGSCCNQDRDQVSGYNFIFLHQDMDGIEITLENIIKENESRNVLIAVHQTQTGPGNYKRAVHELCMKQIWKKVDFSHDGKDNYLKGLLPLIQSVGLNDYGEKFKTLCNLIYSPLDEAASLRSQILTPLVALDLIQQAKGSGKIEGVNVLEDLQLDIRNAMGELAKSGGAIDKFCGLSPSKCDDVRQQLDRVLRLAPFAPDVRDEFHEELKRVAEKMEEQIQAIDV